MSHSRAPDEDPGWSEFENLLRCAADLSTAQSEREQAEVGIKNSKSQRQNEQSLEGPEAETRLHSDRAMSNTSSRAEESPSSSDRRHFARKRIKTLSYLDLGRDNGGIVLNISEGGLAVHAVGIFVDNPILQMRLRLPGSDEQLEATGQVAWTSESKREAGIRFVDLSEQTRTQIKEWVSKQTLSAEREADGGSQSEKRKQVLEIPPRREPKKSVAEAGMFSGMTNEEFNTMFPSEKNPVTWRKPESSATALTLSAPSSATPHASMSPSESAASDRLETITRTTDSLSSFEGEANAPAEKNPQLQSSPKSATPVSPSTTRAHVISNEKLPPQLSSVEAILALPPSSTQIPSSGPVTQMPATPSVVSPVSHNDDVMPLSAPAAAYEESQPAVPPFHNGVALSQNPESGAQEAAEINISAERFSSALPISVESDAVPLRYVEATAPGFEKASPTKVPSPSDEIEVRSSATMVRDLRAVLNRADAIGKSSARHKVAKQEPQTSLLSEGSTAVSPVAEPPIATASSVALSPNPSSPPLSHPEEPAAAQPQIESPMTGILSGAPVSRDSTEGSSQFSKEIWESAKNLRPRIGVDWQPTALLILALLVVLAIGIGVDRGMLDRLRGRASSSANRPLPQAALPAHDNAGQESQSNRVSQEVQPQHRHEFASVGSTSDSVESQHRRGPDGPAAAPRQSVTFAPILSSPIVASRSVQAATSEQESPPAVPVELGKTGDDSLGASGSWNTAAKLAPPQSMPQIANQGDRVVACSLLYRVEALYPPEAAQRHIEGTVKLRAVIGRDGRVMGLGVVSGLPSLVSAAINAAREWRYIPALLNGQPVESETDIDIDFRLSREANP